MNIKFELFYQVEEPLRIKTKKLIHTVTTDDWYEGIVALMDACTEEAYRMMHKLAYSNFTCNEDEVTPITHKINGLFELRTTLQAEWDERYNNPAAEVLNPCYSTVYAPDYQQRVSFRIMDVNTESESEEE